MGTALMVEQYALDFTAKPEVRRNVVAIRKRGPKTSLTAAESALPKTGTQRAQVYEAILEAGERGMTDRELEDALQMRTPSVTARRNSLASDGLIVDSGERRLTPSGNPAIVWKLAKP